MEGETSRPVKPPPLHHPQPRAPSSFVHLQRAEAELDRLVELNQEGEFDRPLFPIDDLYTHQLFEPPQATVTLAQLSLRQQNPHTQPTATAEELAFIEELKQLQQQFPVDEAGELDPNEEASLGLDMLRSPDQAPARMAPRTESPDPLHQGHYTAEEWARLHQRELQQHANQNAYHGQQQMMPPQMTSMPKRLPSQPAGHDPSQAPPMMQPTQLGQYNMTGQEMLQQAVQRGQVRQRQLMQGLQQPLPAMQFQQQQPVQGAQLRLRSQAPFHSQQGQMIPYQNGLPWPLNGYTPQQLQVIQAMAISYKNADLNSRKQTELPIFDFPTHILDTISYQLRGLRKRTRAETDVSDSETGVEDQGMSDEFPFPGTISLWRMPNIALFCRVMKAWLIRQYFNHEFAGPGIVRMETLEMHEVEEDRVGYVLLAEDACKIKVFREYEFDAAVWAVLIPKKGKKGNGGLPDWEKDARFFYTVRDFWPVVQALRQRGLEAVREYHPETLKHKQLLTWIREEFLKAVALPESDDYRDAMKETDCCPAILDSDNALQRLEMNQWLYFAFKDPLEYGRDISDDRYLLHLHPAEREAACLADLRCAEYLVIKRNFFKAFWQEIYRSEKKIDPNASSTSGGRVIVSQPLQPTQRTGDRDTTNSAREDTPMSATDSPAAPSATAPRRRSGRPSTRASTHSTNANAQRKLRVRTETAHQHWLENVYDMRARPARCLIVCWKELGFLDEGRYLDWLRAGGIFEDGQVEGRGEG